jgi:hypothetical protein
MSLADDLMAGVKTATKKWKTEKRRADRYDRVSSSQLSYMRMNYSYSIRDAAFDVMEEAYNKVSSNGRYYANARQIMYAARPGIIKITTKELGKNFDIYFTQTLLKDYLETYESKTRGWKVVWDARGHMIEPFTGHKIGLGGIDVEQYGRNWHATVNNDSPEIPILIDTKGPANRFKNVLFIEKEGFTEVLTDAKIHERYDMAMMSTKGIPVKAACDLINMFESEGVRVFVLHDFDKDGFKIVRTLREGTRMAWGSDVIDLGLRLEDVKDLEAELVTYHSDPSWYLKHDCDATEEEVKFLSGNGYRGHRVEINAMTSEQLITWLEKKFKEYGIEKMIPEDDSLIAGFKRADYLQQLETKIAELEEEDYTENIDTPDDLSVQIKELLKKNPEMSWDQAIWKIAEEISENKE